MGTIPRQKLVRHGRSRGAIRGSPQFEQGHVIVIVAEGQSVLFRLASTYDSATVQQMFGPSTATILADASANFPR